MIPFPVDPENIQVGDRVKSLKFPNYYSGPPHQKTDCYVVGTVRAFIERGGYWCYKIEVEEDIWEGKPYHCPAKFDFPPVNGTRFSPDAVANGVTKINNPGHGRVVPVSTAKICPRCGATSTGGVYCPNGHGRI